jgi:predicted enzyme related to lactoylglutathione lyase
MSGTTEAISELTEPPAAQHAPRPAALPYLSVANARAAIAWYTDAFDAVLTGDPIVMDDGRIGHAELAIADGILYLADEHPEIGLKAPAPGTVSVSLMLHVDDTDAALQKTRERGATVEREIYENYGTRNATIIDPFGHRWMLSGPVAIPVAGIQHGDIGYVSVWTPDADRAAAFYGHVLGWTYDPATHQVTNTELPAGISADPRPTLFCCYAVTDVQAARTAIAEAGGVPGEIRHTDYGTLLDATDPQGAAFAVYQPAAGQKRPELNGSGPGELSYVTYEVRDSAGFRDFYGQVLGWTFEPGRVADGWQVVGTHPMAGAAGGSASATTVPMWTVADIEAAVARVVAAGGTVLQEPARQPYGTTAECTDDQGGRFYLGQF